MPNAHTSVGIAQVVFYAPMVPIVIYLFSRNARIRPRMAWWPLITFALCMLPMSRPKHTHSTTTTTKETISKEKRKEKKNTNADLVRLAGGIVTILAEKKPGNTGLWIAALILLNVGVVPLIVADLGLTRLV